MNIIYEQTKETRELGGCEFFSTITKLTELENKFLSRYIYLTAPNDKKLIRLKQRLNWINCAFAVSYWVDLDMGLHFFGDLSVELAGITCEAIKSEKNDELIDLFFDIDELFKLSSLSKNQIAS